MISRTSARNLTILLGSTLTVLAATIISPALPGMAGAFAGVPNADFLVRLTLTMPALFIAVGALLAGPLLDRRGRKPVLIASLFLYGLAGTAGFFLESLPAILVSRAVLGLAVAGIMSGFTTLILDYFKGSELNRFLGLQGAFIGVGGMLFLISAGFLAEIGWQYPFLIHLFAFLVLPAVFFFIDEPERAKLEPASDVKAAPFPWRKLAPIYITAFAGMAIFFVFAVQIPFHLAESSASQVGLALSLQTLASVFAALQFQRLKARYSFFAIFSLAFLTFSLNHFIVSSSAMLMVTIVGLLIGGLGVGLFMPNANGWLASAAPADLRGKAVGGMTSAIFLGQFFSPAITQPFVNSLGLSTMFAIAGAFALGMAIVFALAAGRQNKQAAAVVKSEL